MDGSIANIGVLKEPLLLKISNGRLIEAIGPDGPRLLELLGKGMVESLQSSALELIKVPFYVEMYWKMKKSMGQSISHLVAIRHLVEQMQRMSILIV